MNVATPPAIPREASGKRSGVLVDTAGSLGGERLRLLRDGQDCEILCGNEQLMGSWCHGSEEALATLTLARLRDRDSRVMIGGLGMGFTLAAARAALAPEASIVVAELVPEVVEWANGPLAHVVGSSLADRRVSLEIRDVHDVIAEQPAAFDAILLDVDNGPDGLISPANDRLYCDWGLRSARAALRPGGILAIWSAYPDRAFADRLGKAGFDVEEVRVDVGLSEESCCHTIWLAAVDA